MLSDFWWIFKERGLSISISFEQSNKAKVVEHISKYFSRVNPLLTEKVFGRVCASFLIIFFSFLAWTEIPTIMVVETASHPIEDVSFPTITICPQTTNSDRWGSTIKILDYAQRNCSSGG